MPIKIGIKNQIHRMKIVINEIIVDSREKNSIGQANRQLETQPNFKTPFFITAIPGSLHIVELCLRYVPSHINTILISNGMDEWEQNWAREHLSIHSIVTLEFLMRHGTILDCLFDNLHEPFGILDYDCFVFNPLYFSKIVTIPSRCIANGLFKYVNPTLNLELPETFFLFFNTEIVKEIQYKYRVSSNQIYYFQIPKEIKLQLSNIGIDESHLPELYKPLIDTCRTVFSLGLTEGYKFNFICEETPIPITEIFHVGGTSLPNYVKRPYQLRGSYFWRRTLDAHPDLELREHYWDEFGRKSASELMNENPEFQKQTGTEFFDILEQIISR